MGDQGGSTPGSLLFGRVQEMNCELRIGRRVNSVAEVIARHSENSGRGRNVAARLIKTPLDESEDSTFERKSGLWKLEVWIEPIARRSGVGERGHRVCSGVREFREGSSSYAHQLIEVQLQIVFEYDGSFDLMSEFADITGPRVRE